MLISSVDLDKSFNIAFVVYLSVEHLSPYCGGIGGIYSTVYIQHNNTLLTELNVCNEILKYTNPRLVCICLKGDTREDCGQIPSSSTGTYSKGSW